MLFQKDGNFVISSLHKEIVKNDEFRENFTRPIKESDFVLKDIPLISWRFRVENESTAHRTTNTSIVAFALKSLQK